MERQAMPPVSNFAECETNGDSCHFVGSDLSSERVFTMRTWVYLDDVVAEEIGTKGRDITIEVKDVDPCWAQTVGIDPATRAETYALKDPYYYDTDYPVLWAAYNTKLQVFSILMMTTSVYMFLKIEEVRASRWHVIFVYQRNTCKFNRGLQVL